MDNTLAYIDQASFLACRALGHGPLIQLTWIYEHEVDIDAVRRFQHALGQGLLGRRIERSPLPFGRHRWVSWAPPASLDVHIGSRLPVEVPDWVEERRAMPIDPESGPPWHLGVLPLTGGGAVLSLVVSHTIADGVGISIAVAEAVKGLTENPGYPPPASRTRRRALREDSRKTIGALSEVAKALAGAARVLRDSRGAATESTGTAASAPARVPVSSGPGSSGPVSSGPVSSGPVSSGPVPSATVFVSVAEWDERARGLGGTSNSLFLGVAARLGSVFERVCTDGSVELAVPVNERTEGDLRGNALTGATVIVDPSAVLTDLRGVRSSFKSALAALSQTRHQLAAPLPLTPFIPKPVVRRLEFVGLGSAAVIGCSNIGDLDPAVNRPDGTDAEYFSIRAKESRMTRDDVQRQGGLLFLVSARVNGQVSVTVSYADPMGSNSREQLLASLRGVLVDFGLSGLVV